MFLKGTGTPYTMKPTDTSKGEQFSPEFLSVSPSETNATSTVSDARSRQVLFGQTASVAR